MSLLHVDRHFIHDLEAGPRLNEMRAIARPVARPNLTFGMPQEAQRLQQAVERVLGAGLRTPDIAAAGVATASTEQMGNAVLDELERAQPASV